MISGADDYMEQRVRRSPWRRMPRKNSLYPDILPPRSRFHSYRLESMANGRDDGLEGVIKFASNSSRTSGTVGRLVLSHSGLRFVDFINSSGIHHEFNSFNNSTLSSASHNSSFSSSSTSDAVISMINVGDVKVDTSRISDGTILLILYCRDFSVHEFQLQFKDESQEFVSRLQKMAAKMSNAGRCSYLWHYLFQKYQFLTPRNWEEHERSWYSSSRSKALRISQSNERLQVCESLPRSFIVPKSITDLVLEYKMAVSINSRRIPIVTYAHNGRFVLMRCGLFDKEDTIEELVMNVHPLRIKSTNFLCPSSTSLKNAYRKLRDACYVTRDADNDSNFLSKIGKWMKQLASCLRVAADVSDILSTEEASVLLVEENDRLWNCIISSLTQIIVDLHRRTVDGLLSLISKEWLYLNGLSNRGLNDANNYHELMTLFLDAIHQLVIQNPTAFEFTTKLLIYLYDQLCRQNPEQLSHLLTGSSADLSTLDKNSSFFKSEYDLQMRNASDLTLLPESVSELLPLYNPFYKKDSTGRLSDVDFDLITLKFWSSLYLRFTQKPRTIQRASRPPVCPQRRKHGRSQPQTSPVHQLSSTSQSNFMSPLKTPKNKSANSSFAAPENETIERAEELDNSSFPEFLYMKYLSGQI